VFTFLTSWHGKLRPNTEGWEIQWGCLVWVPALYTLHSRFLVLHPSNLDFNSAVLIAGIGFAGVGLNYWADKQRMWFRENNGKDLVWGKKPVFIEAKYDVVGKDGAITTSTSLLLASGFWGIARHFHYVFELTAAWSWCILANPLLNGTVLFSRQKFTLEGAIGSHACSLKLTACDQWHSSRVFTPLTG
jgi:7-dehydrocholesterol reductase